MVESEVIHTSPMFGKGKIVVPKEIREYLGVGDGGKIAFLRDEEGKIWIKKAASLKSEGRYELEGP